MTAQTATRSGDAGAMVDGVRAKILVVTGIFPPDAGGPASYVPTMAASLCQRGHTVEVVTLSAHGAHDDTDWPFRVHRIRRRLFWPWRLLLTVFTIWRLSRGKDLVYVNGLGSEAALGAWLARRPTVHKIVGDYAWERARARGWFRGTIDAYQHAAKSCRLRLLDYIRTRPLRGARRVIVPSDYLRQIVAGWGIPPERIEVVYNAVDIDCQGETSTPSLQSAFCASPPPALKTLLTVCRLVPWKGVDALIRVVADLPGTRLLIAGDGPMRAELEGLARSRGAAERVFFLGQIPHAQVQSLLGRADLFVLNSSYEGLPHVVLEAMAAGTPVIASNAGGTGEVVEHNRTGVLVPVGDDAALKAAIVRLCTEPLHARRLAAEASRFLAARFAFPTMVRATENVLLEGAGLTRGLSVLSLGFTRGLWEGDAGEDYQRMLSYGSQLQRYVIVANSYKCHGLAPRRLARNVHAIPTNAYSPLDSLLRMIWIGARALTWGKVNLIQAQDPVYSGVAATVLGKLFRVPVVVCVYGPNVYDRHWRKSHWSHGLLAPLGRWVLRQARCIQVDGRLTERGLIAAGHAPERVAVKPLVPANLPRFLEIHRNGAEGKRLPRFVFAGRFAGQKNLPLLLKAAKKLCEESCPFELHLVGAGPEETSLRAQVERDGLSGCVHFRGNVSREEMVKIFADMDVFVLSSHYEGYPRVLMEAAAAGLPIVTTAVSGADEALIDGESGFIVPVDELGPLVDRLSVLARDPSLRARMGQAGRTHIAAQLDPAANTPRQLAIWRKVTQ